MTSLPTPISNPDSQAYWEAAAQERLIIRKCNSCGQPHFMPRHLCPHCWSDQLEWVDACGRGTVHSFSIIRRAPMQSHTAYVPYVVALIDLQEGPRMLANVVGDNALQTRIGSPVEVCFESRGEGAKVPQFQLATGSGEASA